MTRILHTADWHLGQRLLHQNRDRYEEHQRFLDWLLEVLKDQKIDVLLVAGDVFDVATPPNEALKQYYNFLIKVKATGCRHIVITGGNHDSPSTLEAPAQLLQFLDIHIVGGAPSDKRDLLIPVHADEPNRPAVVICAIPFLRDKDIRKSEAGESFEQKVENIRKGISDYYTEVAELAAPFREKRIPLIATGHFYAEGNKESSDERSQKSERDIHIGNLGQVNVVSFEARYDYIALGHLHRPQLVGKSEQIRYSGSPIPLSFSEKDDQKTVVVIEIQDEAIKAIRSLEIPPSRRLVSIKGTFEQVQQKLQNYQSPYELPDWAEVVIEEDQEDPGLNERFRTMLDGLKKVEVLKYDIRFKNTTNLLDTVFKNKVELKALSPLQVFEKRIEEVAEEQQRQALKQTYLELLDLIDQEAAQQ